VKLRTELWYILSRREKIEGTILLFCMALGALFEAVSIGLLVPFIAVLKNPQLVFKVSVARSLFSALNIHESQQMLIAVGLGLIAVFVVKSVYLVLLYRWLFQYIFATHFRLGRQLLTGYLNSPYTFHLQRNSSELIKATTESVHRFTSGFLLNLLMMLGESWVVLAITVLLTMIEPLATFGAILVLGVPTYLIYRSMQHRLAVSGNISEKSFGLMIQWIEQAVSGIKETLVTGRASFFIDRQGYHLGRVVDSMRTLTFLSGIPRLLIDTLAISAMVVIVLIAVAREQDLQSILPLLTMFAVAAVRLMPSTSRIANGLAQLRFHYAATEVIYKELIETKLYQRHIDAVRSSPRPFRCSLVLEHLSYCYPSTSRPAIEEVSFEIPKGHWVALVGPTGAGKTTLVDMLLGLFVPTSGRILVDGRDLQDDVTGWQRNIGLVPQSVYLIDDTVRANVAFGLPDEEVDDERVWAALRDAQVDGLARSLPGGLNAMIGERGDRLSGGERQRLGIARALYRDPEVLVLDEGTAHLDGESEASIGRTLGKLRGAKTIIMIAHRLALVRNCDRVYFLDQGHVRISGGYSELISKDPAFRRFVGAEN
jgi:ATP-binding cassette subfamily C protein